jgi:hypothetical protein
MSSTSGAQGKPWIGQRQIEAGINPARGGMDAGSTSRHISPHSEGKCAMKYPTLYSTARLLLGGLLLILAGCSTGHHHQKADLDPAEGLKAAEPPAFLRGPSAMLLTNADDFTARVTVSQPNGSAEVLTGTLFQKEGQLLFVPSTETAPARSGWVGTFRFLCSPSENKGWVISERLRGYAAWTSGVRYTGSTPVGALTTEQIEGQTCLVQDVRITGTDDQAVQARVWRPQDAPGPPIRITFAESSTTPGLAVQLADINPDPLTPELFTPPPEDVRFDSTAAMVRELTRKVPVLPYTHSSWGGAGYRRQR